MSSCTQLVLNTIDDINKLLPSLDENSTLKIVKVPKSGGKQKGGMNVDDVTLQLCQLTTESKESRKVEEDLPSIIHEHIHSKDKKTDNDFYVLVALAIAEKRFRGIIPSPSPYNPYGNNSKIKVRVGFNDDGEEQHAMYVPVDGNHENTIAHMNENIKGRTAVTIFYWDDMVLLIDPPGTSDRSIELVIIDDEGPQHSYYGKVNALDALKDMQPAEGTTWYNVLKIFKGIINANGGGKPKKTNMKKIIAGRERVIYKIGQKQYVKMKNSFVSLKDARCIK